MKLQKGKFYYVVHTDRTKKPKVTHIMSFLGMGSIKGQPILRFQKDNQTHLIDKEVILKIYEARPNKMYGGWKKGRELRLEASYPGNMGVMEVFEFYKIASKKEKVQLERLMNAEKFKEAWRLVQKVTKTKLQGATYESFVQAVSLLREIDGL